MNNIIFSINDESAIEEVIELSKSNQFVGRVLIQRSDNPEITSEEFDQILFELRRLNEINSSNNRILMGFVILYGMSITAALIFLFVKINEYSI